MSLLFLMVGLSFTLLMGLLVSNSVALVLLMEITLFIFLFMVYEYKILSLSFPCVKYFFTQTLGSVLLLLFILFAYSLFWAGVWVDVALLFGVCLKLGAFPLHFWVVTVYSELPMMMLGVLGVPMKVLPLSFLASAVASNVSNVLIYILLFLGACSMISGLVMGLGSTTIRSALGASSVTHAGWFVYALGVGEVCKYFLLYSFAFLVVIWGLRMSVPLITAFSMLGLGGLPPFTVFFGKLLVLSKWLGRNIPLVFVVPALVVSVVSLLYYLKFSLCFFLAMPRPLMRPAYGMSTTHVVEVSGVHPHQNTMVAFGPKWKWWGLVDRVNSLWSCGCSVRVGKINVRVYFLCGCLFALVGVLAYAAVSACGRCSVEHSMLEHLCGAVAARFK